VISELVTFGTRRYLHRQLFLGHSAALTQGIHHHQAWNPMKLKKAGFEKLAHEIHLADRGAGFWSWKPFIIYESLRRMVPGSVLLYCDVGRSFPYKVLDHDLAPLISWMRDHGQWVMPGLQIPWHGPMRCWTKRDAFVALNMDTKEIHESTPIQASFSFWVADPRATQFAKEWMQLCFRRCLVSDDPGICGLPELPGFIEHRHDQSLLTLLCLSRGIAALKIGSILPESDEKNPSTLSKTMGGLPRVIPRSFELSIRFSEFLEQRARSALLNFGVAWQK